MTRALLQRIDEELSSGSCVVPASSIHKAVRTELAKPEQSPAWHDAPTCAGLWVLKTVAGPEAHNIEPHDVNEVQIGEWYGPIPEDKA